MFLSSDSTSCHEFASQFGLAIFLYAKNIQNLGEIGCPARVCLNDPATGYECQRSGHHGWVQTNIANLYHGDGGVCVLAHACACVRTRAYACVHDVFAIYDNNI